MGKEPTPQSVEGVANNLNRVRGEFEYAIKQKGLLEVNKSVKLPEGIESDVDVEQNGRVEVTGKVIEGMLMERIWDVILNK